MINDGGPALPWDQLDVHGQRQQFPGMSLRAYFAGQILSGIVACPYGYDEVNQAEDGTRQKIRAEIAVKQADELIVALEASSESASEVQG